MKTRITGLTPRSQIVPAKAKQDLRELFLTTRDAFQEFFEEGE